MEFVLEHGKKSNSECSTLILPALSIGNVGQLAVDLLISSTGSEKIGYLDDPNILPCVGNDAFGPLPHGDLALPLEVYDSVSSKLTYVQQRSPVVKGMMVQFAQNLADFAVAAGMKHVIVLSSLDFGRWKKVDMSSGMPIHYLSSTNADGSDDDCEKLGWKRLQEYTPSQGRWQYLSTVAAGNIVEENSVPFDDDLEKYEDYYASLPFAALFSCFKHVNCDGESSSMVTVKVKGRSDVHEASGLQDSGHILEEGPSIYNTTLSLSDLSSGINSYYILQVIQDDKGLECHVFRKWGRVGNEKIGSSKIEEMSKSDAIEEFKRLFLEKTGNPWEAWVHKKNFRKHPGRFFPLDIDYGVNKQAPKKNLDDSNSKLAPALKELIKMLFNVETYRAAMLEFEINLSEMPLGKLSKSNIQQGFEALTQIQNLLENTGLQPSVKESLIVDASNRFFTMIPSIHPHVIRDEDDFKSKVKMLEALQDIEIASRLVGFDADSDEPLDTKYKKLQCDMVPLSHDNEDYQLIEKYLLTTHAPTHTEWSLELKEVFSLEREGELDKFAPQREKLGNRMLLWHGSRLTNFVGILSQGLRIAPPEAPATGYMFGKGVYFADLVSKSAQYCFTDKKNPVGLMLLSEVALGKVHELKKAQYMDKPPRGKHSTKGLGKKVPDEAGFAKWRDEVVVPCGKPVDSKAKTSDLMYNEYIVYDTAQVKMQYLLKVRFRYKR